MARRRRARASGFWSTIRSAVETVGKTLRSAQRKTSKTTRADSKGFARTLGIGEHATKSPIQQRADQSRAKLEKSADKLGNRKGLARRLETRGVSAREWAELRATSNAHDRRLLDDYARRAARATKRAATKHAPKVATRATPGRPAPRKDRSLARLAASTLVSVASPALARSGAGDLAKNFAHGGLQITKDAVTRPERTATDTAKIALGGMAAIPELVANPGRLDDVGKALAEDIKRRYGPLVSGDDERLRRVLDEEGAAPYLLDVSAILAGAGVGAGRAAGSLARAGKLGRRAREFATRPRPGLQLAGARARRQRLARNLGVVAVQRLHDAARARLTRKKAASSGKGDGTGADALAEAAMGNRAVLPLIRRRVKRRVGRSKGALRLEQQALLDEMPRLLERGLRTLTRDEREAVKYAIQYGIRSDSNVDEALGRLADQIVEARRRDRRFRLTRFDHDELATIDRMAERPRDFFTPELDEIANWARNLAIRSGRRDPMLAPETASRRQHAAQADLLGARRRENGDLPDLEYRPELDRDALRRARRDLGLAVAGYFPSRTAGPRRFGDWAGAFRGLTAPPRHRKYRGRLRELGIESNDPSLLAGAIARNLNNELRLREVTRNIEEQAFDWSKSPGRVPHRTAAELEQTARRLGLDPTSWVAVNPRAINRAMLELGDDGVFDLAGHRAMYEALQDAAISPEGIRENPARYQGTRGYVAIPRAVWDEFVELERPTGTGTRMWNNVKGGWSRLMLGLNMTWLPFQVAGNVAMAALAGAPPGMARAFRAGMRQLSPDEQRRANAILGIGQVSEAFNRQRMGSQATALTRSWAELRETAVGRALGRANVVRHVFALDRIQNNMFRRSVANAALRRMMREAQEGAGILDRLLMRGSPDDYARFLRDPEKLEELADHVNKWLGDYTSLTAAERRMITPSVMFYGWMRHSTKLLLWTMPTNRPIVGSILGQLGKLHAQEIRELFGEDAPAWLYLYSILGETRDGQPIGINAARFIPFVNAIASVDTFNNPAGAALSSLTPARQAAMNSAYGQDLFTGRRVGPPRGEPALGDRMGLGLRTLLGSLPPYRIGERLINPREHEADRPAWLRLLEQTTPIPREVPWSANGPGRVVSGSSRSGGAVSSRSSGAASSRSGGVVSSRETR